MCALGAAGLLNQAASQKHRCEPQTEMVCRSLTSSTFKHTVCNRLKQCWSYTLSLDTSDAFCRVFAALLLCPYPCSTSVEQSSSVYFAFRRQWKFTPELYLIAAGILVGSSVSSAVLLLPPSGSSCTRGSWLCNSVIFFPILFEPIPSRTCVKISFTSPEFA